MKKYFVVSDIHSFYDPLIKALNESGYDRKNTQHVLIVCGDVFDRGPDTIKVYQFLKSIPKSRRILIRGNHEILFKELLNKGFPQNHEFHNGTVRTFCHIAGFSEECLEWSPDNEQPQEYWKQIRDIVQMSEIAQWIQSSEWKNYYELDKYIFVHSFIPITIKHDYKVALYIYDESQIKGIFFDYIPNWRKSKTSAWETASWGCPWERYKSGLFDEEIKKGKVLVCGHWHSYDFRIHLDGVKYDTKDDIDFSTYVSDHLIALDACTVVSNQVNVFTFEK